MSDMESIVIFVTVNGNTQSEHMGKVKVEMDEYSSSTFRFGTCTTLPWKGNGQPQGQRKCDFRLK